MRARAIPIVVSVLVVLAGYTGRAIGVTRDRTEYFLHVHDELAYETGSSQWHELQAEEQAKDLERALQAGPPKCTTCSSCNPAKAAS